MKAKYDDTTWVTVGTPLSNQIRDNSRAALIAYVLNLPTHHRARLHQCRSAVRILPHRRADELVHADVADRSGHRRDPVVRSAMPAEPGAKAKVNPDGTTTTLPESVGADAIDAAQWEWRKNYRVWEANRKVFLYPENWIDPTLRDDRTPFFKDLQAELQRGEVTADLAEQAFQNYLTSLLEVSRLEICGFYWEDDIDSSYQRNSRYLSRVRPHLHQPACLLLPAVRQKTRVSGRHGRAWIWTLRAIT